MPENQSGYLRTNTRLFQKDLVKIRFSSAKHRNKTKENPLSNILPQHKHWNQNKMQYLTADPITY